MRLVSLVEVLPDAIFDLRYATANNVTGKPLYAEIIPELDAAAAEQLQMADEAFRKQSLQVVIWDTYRPHKVQEQLQAVMPDVRYVTQASKHTEGLAVDITLADKDGNYLDMGTDFDDFSPRAHAASPDLTISQISNRAILQQTMEQLGFKQWPYEWWHFEYIG